MIDALADEILRRLAARPGADEVVLGGYFALREYADYRSTHDIDAWWRVRALAAVESTINEVMSEVAAERGFDLRLRRFGDTLSFELAQRGRKHFSFQIAARSVELEPPRSSRWPPILIETLADTIGSKMNALVERGSPRDLTDIREVVRRGLANPAECWALWRRKNPTATVESARQRVLLHIVGLEARRPLESIRDARLREDARQAREWFRREFLGL